MTRELASAAPENAAVRLPPSSSRQTRKQSLQNPETMTFDDLGNFVATPQKTKKRKRTLFNGKKKCSPLTIFLESVMPRETNESDSIDFKVSETLPLEMSFDDLGNLVTPKKEEYPVVKNITLAPPL